MIDVGMVYTIELFKERVGVTDAEVEELVEAGLKVRHFQEKRFVLGQDFADFVGKCHDKPEKEKPEKEPKTHQGHGAHGHEKVEK